MPAFQPYRGKPAVRNDGEGRGNVGIIRSPVRASTLPDCGGACDETHVPTATEPSRSRCTKAATQSLQAEGVLAPRKPMGRKLARLAGRLGCLAMSSYVARPHVLADQFVPGYLGDSFGLFPFVHGDPLANQFDGPFLIRLIGEEVTHTSGFPLGIPV